MSPSVTLACERSRPLVVPLPGELPPYYETLWPLESFRVREIEGSLESRIFISTAGEVTNEDTPLRKAGLMLRNAISGEIVKSFTTDDQGHFKLGDVSPGSYVLQIVQRDEPTRFHRIEGNLLIELRTDANEPHLPLLALSMSDCGMVVHKKNSGNSSNQQSESQNAQTH